MKDYIEHFESVESFAATICSRETNKVFAHKLKMSEYEGPYHCVKCGTKSYQEANALLLNGDENIYNKLTHILARVSAQCESTKRVNAVCGFGVSVPRALTGSAKCMYSRKKTPSDGKIIDVILNIGANCSFSANDINAKLCQMFSVINMLERNDVQTNIYVYIASEKCGQKLEASIKIKDAGQPFNLMKYAYPCASASMIRRHFARFIETAPVSIRREFTKGYGCPVTDNVNDRFCSGSRNKYIFLLQNELNKSRSIEDITEDVLRVVND